MPSYSRKVQVPGKSSKELYDAVANDIDRFLTKAAIGKFEVEKDPAKCELRIKSSMFSATLSCADAQMELKGQLSLLAVPFRTKFDESITRWLSKTFNINSIT